MINRIECHHGAYCPYLNGGDIWRLIGEQDYLNQRTDEMERVMALAQAEIENLRQENEELKEERETLRYELKQMLGKIFKPRIKPNPEVNRPKRGAPCDHRGNSRRRPEDISKFIKHNRELFTDISFALSLKPLTSFIELPSPRPP